MKPIWMIASAVCVAACPAFAASAFATDVKIHVIGVTSDSGVVRVQVCTPETFMKDCPYKASGPATVGATDVVVKDVPPGTYAMLAHHDINNNGKVDRNFLGIPEEGVGFSRDPLLTVRAPTFAETSVPVEGALVEFNITLKFEPSH